MSAGRVPLALLGAAFLAAFNYYFYYDEDGHALVEPPGGREFWFHSTPGELLIVGVVVLVGILVARWWVLGIALVIALSEIVWAVFERPGDFQGLYPPTRDASEVLALVAMFALFLGVGVGLAKVGRWARARASELLNPRRVGPADG